MPRLVVFVVVTGLTIYALIDCVRTESRQIKVLPKLAWLLLILLASPVGPVVWLLAGRERGRPTVAPRRVAAPDDDPDFLRRLSDQQRQQAADEQLRQWEAELRDRDAPQGDDGEGPAPAPSPR